jgi:hypothetical protein
MILTNIGDFAFLQIYTDYFLQLFTYLLRHN